MPADKKSGSYIEAPYSGVRWYHESHLLEGFRAAGFTRRGLRAFLRALGVPTIYLPSGRHYDGHAVAIAMKAAGRIGNMDFAAPGSEPLRRSETTGKAVTLDPRYVREHLDALLAEMWASRPKDYRDRDTLRKEASRVGNALVQFAILERAAREVRDTDERRNIRRAQQSGYTPSSSERHQ